MFKHLVPVVALALLAGPVFAAGQAPASTPSAADQSSTASSKHHKKNHHSKSSKSKKSTTDSANAPAK
jgi:hypothetical protein